MDITRCQYQNQTDYILCSQRWRSSIQSAKTRPGADCGSNHELLIAKFRLKLKKVGKTARPKSLMVMQRWQGYIEELYRKDLHDPDNHNGVITHLQPDILESEVKWALGSIMMNKASGGDGLPTELFQILKDDIAKVLHSICQWPQDWKRSVFIPIPKKAMSENVQTTAQLYSLSMLAK